MIWTRSNTCGRPTCLLAQGLPPGRPTAAFGEIPSHCLDFVDMTDTFNMACFA